MIDSFSGKYSFLSNFAPVPVELDGVTYPSVEAAYQAAKTIDDYERMPFTLMGPSAAKRAGRKVTMRADWPDIKLGVMRSLCRQKFNQEPYRSQLLATGNQDLVEGNYWGDTYWGVCRGLGTNHLGRILVGIRAELVAADRSVALDNS